MRVIIDLKIVIYLNIYMCHQGMRSIRHKQFYLGFFLHKQGRTYVRTNIFTQGLI